MPAKQGGKGKQSSPSDQSYWKRVNPERQREKRIARHRAKMGLNQSQIGLATSGTLCPRLPVKREQTRVTFTGTVPDQPKIPFHCVFIAGVLTEISPRISAAHSALQTADKRHASHEILLPDYGRRIPASE